MNRLISFALLLVSLWYLFQSVRRTFFRKPRPAEPTRKDVTNQPVTLERDPVTGVFRTPKT